MKYDYFKLLDIAYEKLKEKKCIVSTRERLEIPLPKITYQKNWTILLNAKDFASCFNRNLELIAKFLQIEYNAPTKIEDSYIIIMRKISFDSIKEKMKKFAKEFVLCPICGKPDTIIVKKERISYLKCMACGAESPILYRIK